MLSRPGLKQLRRTEERPWFKKDALWNFEMGGGGDVALLPDHPPCWARGINANLLALLGEEQVFGLFKSKKPSVSKDLEADIKLLMLQAFPNGDHQRDVETSRLHAALNGKITRKDAGSLLVWSKVLLITSIDPSPESISDGIFRHEQGRLTRQESLFVYKHLTGYKEPLFTGGSGAYPEDSVIINCSLPKIGVWAEKKWLRENIGEENKDWSLVARYHGHRDNGSAFETYAIKLPDGEEKSIHFDITQWYLKV